MTAPRLHRTHRFPIRGLLALVAALVVLLVGVALNSERLFFYPSRLAFDTPEGRQDVWFTNGDGQRLHGWFIPPAGDVPQPWPAVLHVHGNAGNLTDHVEFCEWLTEHGYAVMLFDYRSYGRSDTGALGRDEILRDASAALDTLLARDEIDPQRVAVFGFSLGGATSIRLMDERDEPAVLVAAAPFSGWRRVAGDYVPVLSNSLVADGGDPETAVEGLGSRPVLFLHGTADGIVRSYHTERLLAAAQRAGIDSRRMVFDGLDHNRLLLDEAVRAAIVGFLDERLR